jgi:hypothetical protein
MIYNPSPRARPRDRASSREMALWLVVMAFFLASLLVIAGVSAPFSPGPVAKAPPTATRAESPVPTVLVPLSSGTGVSVPTAGLETPPPSFPSQMSSPTPFGLPQYPPMVLTPPVVQPVLPAPSVGIPTVPGRPPPQYGRPLPSPTEYTTGLDYYSTGTPSTLRGTATSTATSAPYPSSAGSH